MEPISDMERKNNSDQERTVFRSGSGRFSVKHLPQIQKQTFVATVSSAIIFCVLSAVGTAKGNHRWLTLGLAGAAAALSVGECRYRRQAEQARRQNCRPYV